MKAAVDWQCLLCTEDSSVFEQPGGFTLAIGQSGVTSEPYTKNSLDLLLGAKKSALLALGISEWKLNQQKLQSIPEGQVAELSGTYKNAEGETIRFKELHIIFKKKSAELLFTNQVGKAWSESTIEKTKRQMVQWLSQ